MSALVAEKIIVNGGIIRDSRIVFSIYVKNMNCYFYFGHFVIRQLFLVKLKNNIIYYMITNGCEIKEWFLRTSYNSKIYKYNKEYLGNVYFISANISDDIKNKFLEKISPFNPNLEYAGAVLGIQEKDGIIQIYALFAYFIGKAEYNGYLVVFLNSELINVTLDWKKYVKSKKYIDINIPPEDVIINNFSTQGFKNENIYTNTRVLLSNNTANAMTELLDKKYRVRNFTSIFENKAFPLEPNYFEYFYLSRTPSICILANSICKLSKSGQSHVSKNFTTIENENDKNFYNLMI